ncbi:MAG: ABC transporter ATP-binding protein [Syntrophobacteraceae bacterium]
MQNLKLKNVHTFYGTSHILFGISLEVKRGECVCLLGRNGVGKTTTLKTIMGLADSSEGEINFNGRDIVRLPPYEIARMGMGYVPEERIVFPDLTVRENLEVAAKPPLSDGIPPWSLEAIFGLFPSLKPLENRPSGYLSGGEQQMLTIGRTLMGNPQMMLLDEPVEGLAPVVVQEIVRQVKHLKELGLTILFTEQNMRFATEISDRAYIIESGLVRYEGTMADLEMQPEIKKKYLMI